MKNVKILRVLLCLFVAGNIVVIIFGLRAAAVTYPEPNDFEAYYSFLLFSRALIKQIILLPCCVLLFQTVHCFIKDGYFNTRSAAKLKLSGILLMAASVTGYISMQLFTQHLISAMNMQKWSSVQWVKDLPELFVLLLIGFGLYTLSDFIRKGEAIERENELTI